MGATLEMIFVNAGGSRVTLRVADPQPALDEQQVRDAMEAIVEKDVFTSSGGSLVGIVAARIVTREVTDLNILQ
ncbi:DUF2922 domain-containing protein [Desulfofalx alkaliphila]|uniref:DUF2922 domain-containing protein n=1 Tax=Desulfofalx alkaliphila TaxID=105483 RepID=UPI0004E1BECE|nr:DUF2922 domain-containing protein [Desulfofalx alkaliphila]